MYTVSMVEQANTQGDEMQTYQEREMAKGRIWVVLQSGAEVYGEDFTIIVRRKFQDDGTDISELYMQHKTVLGTVAEHRITKWG